MLDFFIRSRAVLPRWNKASTPALFACCESPPTAFPFAATAELASLTFGQIKTVPTNKPMNVPTTISATPPTIVLIIEPPFRCLSLVPRRRPREDGGGCTMLTERESEEAFRTVLRCPNIRKVFL